MSIPDRITVNTVALALNAMAIYLMTKYSPPTFGIMTDSHGNYGLPAVIGELQGRERANVQKIVWRYRFGLFCLAIGLALQAWSNYR